MRLQMRNGRFLFVCTLISGLCLIFTGCGDDEETVDPRDLLLGSWEVLTIDGKSLLQYYRNDADFDDLTSASIEIVFLDNGTMIINMSMGFTAYEYEFGVDMILKFKATYTVSGSKLIFVIEESKGEINVDTETKLRRPDVDWDAFEAEFNSTVSAESVLDTDTMTWEVIGDRLFLDDGDEEMVLIRN